MKWPLKAAPRALMPKTVRHHHFICDRCGNVEDVEWYDVPKPASGSLGRRILRECELIARGLCTKCARAKGRRRAGAESVFHKEFEPGNP